jgi:hypothetical protein
MQDINAQPEMRTLPTHRSSWSAIIVILVVAATIRFIGLRWGLPNELHLFSYHPDEFHSLRGALALACGDVNPHFFNYGSLYLYLVGFASLFFAGGPGALITVERLPALLQQWTLIGREVTLIAALLTVLTVYFLAREIAGHRQGLIAAGLCAIFPIHVLHSHYATVDVTQALFTTLAVFFAVRAYRAPSRRNYILAGLAVGLAASAKYSGAVAIAAPLTAFLLTLPRDSKDRLSTVYLLWLLVTAAGAFAITSPYTFLDWQHAQKDILYEIQHMRVGEGPALAADPNGYWFHLVNLAITTTGGAILAVFGAWAFLRDDRYRGPALIIIIFAIIWLVMIGQSGVRYMRYEIPLVPLVAVLAAAAPLLLWRTLPEIKLIGVLALMVVFGASAYHSYLLDRELIRPDSRDHMLWLISEYVPMHETVATIWEPWFHGPPLDYVNGGTVLRQNPLWQTFSRDARPHLALGLNPEALREAKPWAVIYSNFEIRDNLRIGEKSAQEFVQLLAEDYRKVVSEASRAPLYGWCGWQPPQDWLYPFPQLTLWVSKQGVANARTPDVEAIRPKPGPSSEDSDNETDTAQ